MRWAAAIAIFAFTISLAARAQMGSDRASSIPQYELAPHDPVPLPIGAPGDWVTGIFGCTDDNSVFVIMMTNAPGSSMPTGMDLYGIRSGTDIVKFTPQLAPGFRSVGPISRYFATDSKVVALAYGTPIGYSDLDEPKDPVKHSVPILLTFDRTGRLLDSATLTRAVNPQQVALFPSGDILILRWDDENRRTSLAILNSKGRIEREIPVTVSDPGEQGGSGSGTALVGVEIYSWGQDLLLVPEGANRPIVEVSETGVVNTWSLHFPKGYERALPVAFDPHSWLFRMVPPEKPLSSDATTSPAERNGLAYMERFPGVVMAFDPSSGDPVREFTFPSGLEPACESNGKFVFLGAKGGGLQFATALVPN